MTDVMKAYKKKALVLHPDKVPESGEGGCDAAYVGAWECEGDPPEPWAAHSSRQFAWNCGGTALPHSHGAPPPSSSAAPPQPEPEPSSRPGPSSSSSSKAPPPGPSSSSSWYDRPGPSSSSSSKAPPPDPSSGYTWYEKGKGKGPWRQKGRNVWEDPHGNVWEEVSDMSDISEDDFGMGAHTPAVEDRTFPRFPERNQGKRERSERHPPWQRVQVFWALARPPWGRTFRSRCLY